MNNIRKKEIRAKKTCEGTVIMLLCNQKPETLPITFPKNDTA